MTRRKDSPQKAAMREMMRDYLKNNDISIKDGTDVALTNLPIYLQMNAGRNVWN